ncbi:Oidioi.mRNA.OKI2018_I69.PAR.g8663.t1.cds [Oikopleura dioica]|uniref:Oidioi.mRNA.OKI2018_I69.PAR.g8663.t1.cds n=1 Tax=Oikopleura dioica TaxID=34765 RepID=A0ABN7RMF0_OIKDI|nr:Oidioi.mRNA.OKI2018_I69.PAR.g8663.t1.cds [Oikopleura dioica]
MKVLPIVLAAAASGQQVSDEATAAWASVQQTGINLYNGVLAAYENKNIPPVRKAFRQELRKKPKRKLSKRFL